MQIMTGGFAAATATSQQALALYHDLGDQAGQAEAISNLGFARYVTDDY
jgi:hypothetical protein